MKTLFHYFRYAFRQFIKSPGFTLAAVLCLSIGIGANISIFDIARSFLFPDMGIREPERIVRIYSRWSDDTDYGSISIPDWEDVRDRVGAFESVAVEAIQPYHVATGGEAERTWGLVVSGNYFATLGVPMALGRDFTPEEYSELGSPPVFLISHRYWQRRFGGDPGVIGQEVSLNGVPFTIIGVVAPQFKSGMVGTYSDIFAPLFMREQIMRGWSFGRGNHWLNNMVARMKEGVSIEQARSEVEAVFVQLSEEYPDLNIGLSAHVLPEGESSLHPMLRSQFQAVLIVLTGLTGILLLLTCANIAGLILARSSARRRELGIRVAMGADRRQLIGQLMAESVMLGLASGIVAYFLTFLIIPLVQSLQPSMDIPLEFTANSSWLSVWITPLLSLLAALFFGLLPALEVSREDVIAVLQSGRVTAGKRSHRLRNIMVGAQVAASLLLLICAGLFLRSMRSIQNIYPGFDPSNQLVATLDLDLQGYSGEDGRAFYRDAVDHLSALPGVEAVGLGEIVPLSFSGMSTWTYPEGYEIPGERPPSVSWNMVDNGYFAAMGIPFLKGSGFTGQEDSDSPRLMVINQAFVDRFWPGEEPLGRIVRLGGQDGTPYEVIGVVPTGRYFLIGEDPQPFFYRSYHQTYIGSMNIHVRTTRDPAALFPAVQRTFEELDPSLPVANLSSMESQMDLAFLASRLVAGSVSSFALMALLLASIGLYGLIAYSVTQQTREIGIRIALGAQAKDVLLSVVRRGMFLVLIGAVVGLALGLLVSVLISRVMYGLAPIDITATLAALCVLVLTAALASYIPARRATRVNPVDALRVE